MKVNVPAPQDGKNSLETTRGKFIDFLANLSLADKKLILFPHESSDVACGSIMKWEELPDSSVILKKYPNGLHPKPKGGDKCANALLGHRKTVNFLSKHTKQEYLKNSLHVKTCCQLATFYIPHVPFILKTTNKCSGKITH